MENAALLILFILFVKILLRKRKGSTGFCFIDSELILRTMLFVWVVSVIKGTVPCPALSLGICDSAVTKHELSYLLPDPHGFASGLRSSIYSVLHNHTEATVLKDPKLK